MAFDDQLAGELEETLDRMTDTLLAGRNTAGHWEGELSSSALSTATAVIALTLQARAAGWRRQIPKLAGSRRQPMPTGRRHPVPTLAGTRLQIPAPAGRHRRVPSPRPASTG